MYQLMGFVQSPASEPTKNCPLASLPDLLEASQESDNSIQVPNVRVGSPSIHFEITLFAYAQAEEQ